MNPPVRILHLEDSPRDAELIRDRLEAAGLSVDVQRAETREAFEAALVGGVAFDLILCDYNLPSFDGLTALALARERQPAAPALVISGSLNEEQAVQCLHRGATDYILKDRLDRLPSAVRRALGEAAAQRRQRESAQKLAASERRLRTIFENEPACVHLLGPNCTLLDMNPAGLRMIEADSLEQVVGQSALNSIAPGHRAAYAELVARVLQGGSGTLEFEIIGLKGTRRWLETRAVPMPDEQGQILSVLGVARDITAHKQAIAALEASERMLQLVLNSVPLGVFWKDRESRFLGCNKIVARRMGIENVESIKGRTSADLGSATPEQAAFFMRKDREVMETDQAQLGIVEPATFADSSIRWLETNKVPMHDAAGKVIGVLGTWQDITVRMQAEEALRMMRFSVDHAGDSIFWVTREGRILYVNDAGCASRGYTREELLAMSIFDLNPDFEPGVWEPHFENLKRRGTLTLETRHRAKDGRILLVEVNANFVNFGGQEFNFSSVRDITQRKRAEAQIREQNEILEAAGEAIIITGLDHRAIFWNRGATRLYGWSAAEALGRTAGELFDAPVFARMKSPLWSVLRHGEWQGEITQHNKAGLPVFVYVRASLVRDEAGRGRALMFLGTDISETKQLAAQLQQAQRLESLGMLAAGVAHDFNNAMSPILLISPMLREYVADPAARKLIGTIEQCTQRGTKLVGQLLSFARGAHGVRQIMEVNLLLREVVELTKATFAKSIVVAAHLPRALWPVSCNPTQFHQVFLNLCINARDAMPSGGALTLTAANTTLDAATAATMAEARPGAFLTVEVRDTGSGIPPEVLARIWEPFYTTKGEGKGTGLGLSTVRGIVHDHHGFVTVATRVGAGTAFTVYLPADKGGAEAAEIGRRAAKPARGNGELIFVVDDDEPVRLLAGKILGDHGYRTLTAGDGAEALRVIAPHEAELRLLLTDLQMPIMDGLALGTALRQRLPALPIVTMSGADTRGSAAANAFISAVLDKPFTQESLLTVVRRTLDAARPAGSSPALSPPA